MQTPTTKISVEARHTYRKLASKLTTKTRKVTVKDTLDIIAKKLKKGEWKIDALDIPEK